nr:glycosyltransferase family 2 protein [Mammaliicoccus sp. Marseille-Q6498]
MRVSIIIPIYNAEKTIKETIETITSKYSHEIICINDGSKDNSAEIISNINNPNIVLINRENKGAAATRNEGIDLAKGEYIMFCDADDKLSENIIDKMVDTIEEFKTDIVIGQVAHLIGENIYPIKTYDDLKGIQFTNLNETPEMIQSIGPYGKLYKKSILNNIRFDEDITFCEEHTFNLKAWAKSNITVIDDLAYLYNIGNDDSIVANSYKKIDKYLSDAKVVRERTFEILKDLDDKVGIYYSYRMDYLIIYFLIRNNYMKTDNIHSLLNASIDYLTSVKHIKSTSVKTLENLILTLSATMNFKIYKEVSKKLSVYYSNNLYIKYKLKAQTLKLKMFLRHLKNKKKKMSH